MLEDNILKHYKEAMKQRDKIKSSILSLLRSNLMNESIRLRKKSLEDKDVIGVIKHMVKQHRDSIEQFKKGGREDLVAKESQELEILKSYLPAELSLDEIKQIIEQVICDIQATSPKDMGRVMKEVMEKVASRADGRLVSELVKKRLKPIQEEKIQGEQEKE